ncbi:MAG TPA: AI-2E family transporter [Acetobacteraceae bacterium]|nr:AI-2E family transporter [Acetobacteraceae bacterium]
MTAPHPAPPRRARVGGWPITIVGLILVLLVYELRYTLIPFVFAAVIGFVLDPVVRWCARRCGGRRWPAATVLSLLILLLVVGGAMWVAQQSVAEITQAADKLPEMLRRAVQALAGPRGLTLFGAHYTPQQITAMALSAATNLIGGAEVLFAVRFGIGVLAAAVLTLVLIPYFLVSGPRIAEGVIWLVPPERRRGIEEMLPVLVPVLRRYVVGLFCVVTYAALLAYIGLGPLFHVPGAPLLSLIVGFLELIPVIGPILSLTLIGLAAISKGGFVAIFLMAYALAVRLSIDNLFGPLTLGKSARVHPIVVIFAFVVGAFLFGVIGLLLAVPVAASIRIILQHYYAEPIAPSGVADWPAPRLDNEAGRSR